MVVDVITIFPAMVKAMLAEGVIARAQDKGLVEVTVRDLRSYTSDRHRTVDDVPYGGGPGMVMKPEPLFRAVEAIEAEHGRPSAVVLMSPQGQRLTHAVAARFSREARVVIICGRYEGVDERVVEALVTDEISIGDYVLTGGEIPAMVLLDAAIRLVPGVVGDANSVAEESFVGPWLDYPHYTRPAECRGRTVPDVLLSGNHAQIARWRQRERVRRTAMRRPDLVDPAALNDDDRREFERVKNAAGTISRKKGSGILEE